MHIILVTKKKFNHMFQLGAGAGAGAEICPEPEPEKSKMTGSGNPGLGNVVYLQSWSSKFQILNHVVYFTHA